MRRITMSVQTQRLSLRKFLWIAPLTVVAALIPSVGQWPLAGPVQIIFGTLVYMLLGSLVFALVVRFSSRPVRTYWIVASIGLILSLALPISAGAGYVPPGQPVPDTATVITLSLMHMVAYAITLTMFTRLTRTTS